MTVQTQLVLRALLDEPDAEHYGFELSKTTGLKDGTMYPMLARLEDAGWIEGFWEQSSEKFDFATGEEGSDERDVEAFGGQLAVPFSGKLLGYVSSRIEDQDSKRRLTRVFDSERHVAGLTWKTRGRVTTTLEAGVHDLITFEEHAGGAVADAGHVDVVPGEKHRAHGHLVGGKRAGLVGADDVHLT